ncbi:acetyl-CoA synthetase-like protein [Aspergillus homomorphus CBS 101889]|uniref:Acetyl-CoA synthetase-like protein n=1 Tax=Aspergillus homomorphus (strain CBS 101889) TaxID=1450537 RepID=A0A395I9Z7_ASPHC|nr:acetyl-CoA synthetase-like protein [Aspergillus homomorphus CBS 101889]RAL16033.1 acetyl-CoA synthetase-like protein [Aspergillus homomorphus CBS 101889]
MTTWTPSTDFDPRTQLVPNIVDHYAKVKPEAIYAEYPVNPMSYDDGYRPVTYKALANAINGVAKWLTETLGPGNGKETLAYLGGNDLRYPALVLGAVKAGYCIFLTSPRNSAVAHQSLFTKLECTTLLAPSPHPPFIAGIQAAHPILRVVDAPSTNELLTTEYPPFPYLKTYPEAAHDRLAILHTSGSTGIPKPIIWTHEGAVKHMHMQRLAIPEGCEGQDQWGFGKRVYLSLPPFHAAGLGHILFIMMPVDCTLIIPTAAGLPSAAGLVAARKQTPFDWAIAVPSIVQELAQNPELLDYISQHLEYMMYCGGDLPQVIGDTVARKLKIVNGYGATEMGILNVIHKKSTWDPLTDWRYLHFHPELGMEFRHVSGSEYEAVVVRTPAREGHQFPFHIFPDRQEYHTNDLMIPHPTKPGLWRPSARLDDVIVFLNGEKTNPVSMEQYIVSSNPGVVTGALVAGTQRFQASLLVELGGVDKALSTSERAAWIEKIWPSIQQANTECPAHARITKSQILFTTPDKPMLRAGKGTVQRAGTLALYAAELDALYNDAERFTQLDGGQIAGPRSMDDAVQVTAYIRDSILSITGWNAELSDDKNWLEMGLDSLQAITLTRVLKQGLNLPTLTPNLIYLHPSVRALTQAVQQLHHQGERSKEQQQQALLQEREQLLQELTAQIEKPNPAIRVTASPASHTVILTGSTGQLGTYILSSLLQSPSIKHIHCLNRNDRAQDKQSERLAAYGLAALSEHESHVSFHSADLSRSDLGLQHEILTQLQQTATLVIHNAWPVNFNLPLASFKPHLQGVVNLLNFTTRSVQCRQLFLLSSVSSIFGHRTEQPSPIPETVIETTTPAPNGYANSKYIAEHLLAHAAHQQGKRTPHYTFARIGQVAGAVRAAGRWNPTEWFPCLVRSARHLHALPDTLGDTLDRIDWVPVDLLADILIDLALRGAENNQNAGVQVFHPVNLHAQPWNAIRPVVAKALATDKESIETVPLRKWVQLVRQDMETATNRGQGVGEEDMQVRLERNPAARLLGFFEGLLATTSEDTTILETERTAEVSEKLRAVDGVKAEWLEKWMAEWLLN